MSKVLRSFVSLLFLLTPLAAHAAQTSASDMLDSALEWMGHPVLTEKRIVRDLTREYLEELRKDTESQLEVLLSNVPSNKAKFKQWSKQIRQEISESRHVGGIRYDFPGWGKDTILMEGAKFPDQFYEFQVPNGKVEYFLKTSPSQPIQKWMELKLQGSFFLYAESGALLYFREAQGFPLLTPDLSQMRFFYQEEKKHKSDPTLYSENKALLFYFPNHNVLPFYILLISKILLIIIACFILLLYSKRFWTFLKDQTKRSHKAEISFLRKKEKAEGRFFSE